MGIYLEFFLAMTLRIMITLLWLGSVDVNVAHTVLSSTTTVMKSIDLTNGCANSSWAAKNQSCYLYVWKEIDFNQANESCKTLNANLVSISSFDENDFIREYVRDINLPVWIGLYRPTNELCTGSGCANWKWLDGSEVGYEQWTPFLETTGQCVYMAARGAWGHSVLCSTKYGYVCEQKRIIPTTTSEPTTPPSMSKMTTFSDPDGCANTSLEDKTKSCYLYVREEIDFYQANESCKTLVANLVSISSDQENQFIRELVGDINLPVWIGLYRPTNELCTGSGCPNWKWLDGSEVGYEQWTPFLATTGQCVFMSARGAWGHSVLCSTKYGYVCEQKRIIPTTTSEPTTQPSTSKMTTYSDPVATVDSPVVNDDFSTYIRVSVSVVIIVISVSIGLGVYYMKTRLREKRNTQTSSGTSKLRSSSIGTGECENCNPDASCSQHAVYENGVQFNILCGREEEVHTSIYTEHAEVNSAYEKVNNYSEVRPEYTCLQVASTAGTKVESDALYANVEHQ